MREFDWRMSPVDFVGAVSQLARRIRKRPGDTHAQRRFAREIARRRRRWFMQLRGLTSLPPAGGSAEPSAPWYKDEPGRLRLVVPPEPDSGGASVGGASVGAALRDDRRKRMKRVLHSAARTGGDHFDLVGVRKFRKRLPPIARAPNGSASASRALYLEALGIAIMPNLTDEVVIALEEAGATVLENETIVVDEPVACETPASIGASRTSHLEAIGIERARELDLTGKGVLIGVLDSGIDSKHPEFAGKTIHFAAFKPGGERDAAVAKDFGGHGTHVAALSAGRTVGVAPDSDLAIAAVLTTPGENGSMLGYRSQILAGLNWLAGDGGLGGGVDVVNASLGSRNDPLHYHGTVLAGRLAGLLTVASIGNEGVSGIGHHTAPGTLDCALAVGAIDGAGQVASFSSWGPCFAHPDPSDEFKPDIMAPGVDVESASPGGGYVRKSGTSMAAPIVTGACALLIEHDGALRGDPDALVRAILDHASPLPPQPSGYDHRRGGRGRLNLANLTV